MSYTLVTDILPEEIIKSLLKDLDTRKDIKQEYKRREKERYFYSKNLKFEYDNKYFCSIDVKKTNGDDVESVEVLKEAGKFLINRLNSLSYVLITNADPKFVFGLADIMNDPKCNKSEFSLEIGCATDSLDIGGDQYAKYWIKVNNHKKVDSVCKQMVDSINIAYDTQGLNVYVEAIKPKAEVVYRIWANNKMF